MKKKINVILIIVIAALWGTAGYKFIRHFFYKQELARQSVKYTAPLGKIQKDTFALLPLSRDPFLNKLSVSEATVRRGMPKARKAQAAIPKPPGNLGFPSVEYFGYIKSGEKQGVLLRINGKLLKMRPMESRNGLYLKSVFKDSVHVIFGKERKNIVRHGN